MGVGLSHHKPTDSDYTREHMEKVTDYLPMQKANTFDNQTLTDLWVK
jgi:hypothetical protein